MSKSTKSKVLLLALLLAEVALLLVVTYVKPFAGLGDPEAMLLNMILTRGLAGLLFIVLIRVTHYPVLGLPNFTRHFWILDLLLPFIIAINNLPIECITRGEGKVTEPTFAVVLLLIECFCIGLFEETAFRGFFMVAALDRFHKTKFQVWLVVLISSIAFGALHFLNVIEGSGIGAVMQQVGYSMLVGAMCAILFVLTGTIWFSVLIHALFDFCGLLLPTLGYGSWFYSKTILITVILVVIVGAYLVYRLLTTPLEKIRRLLPPCKEEPQ